MAASPDIIGCDVGGTAIQCALLRGSKPRCSLEVPTPKNRARFIDALSEAVLQLAQKTSHGRRSRPTAVGVGFCGLLDARQRSVIRSTSLPALDGFRLAARLERRTGLLVTLDTDTNAGAVAEAAVGAGRGYSRVLYVSLGTGLGAALVVDRRPVRVSYHTVGQIAGILIADARPASAGTRTAESLLSTRGILQRARRRGMRRPRSTADLFAIARAGDATARAVWREVGQVLGHLLHTLATLWSPDVVVIGGGTTGARQFFLAHAERELEKRWSGSEKLPPLRAARQGPLSGAVGAALLAREAATDQS